MEIINLKLEFEDLSLPIFKFQIRKFENLITRMIGSNQILFLNKLNIVYWINEIRIHLIDVHRAEVKSW